MKGSRWLIVLVILAIIGVIIAKESMKGRTPEQPAVAAQPPARYGADDETAPNVAGPADDDSQQAAAPTAPSGSEPVAEGQTSPPPALAKADVPEGGAKPPVSPQSASKADTGTSAGEAETKKPEGPLPGSRLADCLKSGRPTMADFGRGWCVPCKMMVPVLKQAAQDYWGKANIVFVELDEYPELGRRHRIATMPTQIFFDAKGKEVTRHMGFMGTEDMERRLAALGVKK